MYVYMHRISDHVIYPSYKDYNRLKTITFSEFSRKLEICFQIFSICSLTPNMASKYLHISHWSWSEDWGGYIHYLAAYLEFMNISWKPGLYHSKVSRCRSLILHRNSVFYMNLNSAKLVYTIIKYLSRTNRTKTVISAGRPVFQIWPLILSRNSVVYIHILGSHELTLN